MDIEREEYEEIAGTFGFDVSDAEREAFRDELTDMIDELEAVTAADGHSADDPAGERLGDDEHNAVRRWCSVSAEQTGPLSDYRIGIKDNIAVEGVPMDCGSSVLTAVPEHSATVVSRLTAAGGEVVCKTNMDEFAGSVRGVTSAHGPIRNPHDRSRTAGGSSGGSAVVVSTGTADVALGTDTGGSVRIPASFCGVFGLKPTYGRIPLTGIVEHTYCTDHVGIFAESLEDVEKTLACLDGPDEGDVTSQAVVAEAAYEPFEVHETGPHGSTAPADTTVGAVSGLDLLEPPVRAVFERTADRVSDRGCTVTRVDIGDIGRFAPVHKILSMCSLAAYWRSNGVPYRRGGRATADESVTAAIADAKRRGDTDQLSTYLKAKLVAGELLNRRNGGELFHEAMRAKQRLTADLDAALADVDLLLLPTVAGLPPAVERAGTPGYDNVALTRPVNVTGHPAMTVPSGSHDGLPVGMQLITTKFDEAKLFRVADWLQPS